ncbi:MAG TPA: YdcF family protein [Burkholderiaceae bacterium]|nr:YdcF family protein [Burkholderiaceae bacterium]
MIDVGGAGFELAALKPVLGALLLPPGVGLLLVAAGWRLRLRPGGRLLMLAALALCWLSLCGGMAQWLQDRVLRPPPPLSEAQVQELAESQTSPRLPRSAIVVLGAGRESLAPENGRGMLSPVGLHRLAYGLWLARRSGLPLAYAGGVGWADRGETSEAEIASAIAREEHRRPLRWVDDRSRDTRENAQRIVPLLAADGVRRIVLVTSASHMPRALRLFRTALIEQRLVHQIELLAAPTGFIGGSDAGLLAWLPSAQGALQVNAVCHELAGLAQASLWPFGPRPAQRPADGAPEGQDSAPAARP